MELSGTQPILCAPIIRQIDQHLIDLLASLDPAEWELPTIAPEWSVRDVAAHLLDTALRKLSRGRDQCQVERVDVRSHQDVIALVNRLNREGVTVYRRLSPPVLIALMQLACAQAAYYYESLDPFATAAIGVSWAGEMTSLVWFDVARELTERWHHQQQIRLATNRPGIMLPPLYHPVLDILARPSPCLSRCRRARRHRLARRGLRRLRTLVPPSVKRWLAFASELPLITAHVTIPQAIAWRVFTKGIDRASARAQLTIRGDVPLAEHILELIAIVG